MSDFDALREQVEQTAGRLAAAQTDRQTRTENLLGMLGRLEDRFNVQQEQLTHYRTRVDPLEQSNRELCELMQSLLNIIDADIVAGQDDPLHSAVDLATRMLAEDMAPDPAMQDRHGGAAEPDMRFEDAPAQLLDAEAESEAEVEAGTEAELPAAVSDAEAEALAMSIGARSAESSADTELLDDDPAAGVAEMSEPPADDGSDADAIIAEEIAAEDMPPEIAESVADGAAEPAMEEAAQPVLEDTVENRPAAEAEDAESLTAELNIPEPDAGTVIEAEAESAVAEALEEALDSMSEAETAVAEGVSSGKPDIRSLLKRVEEAAHRAQALTRGHAGAGDGEDAAPVAEADETTEPSEPAKGSAAA